MVLLSSPQGMQFLNLVVYPDIEIHQNTFTFLTGKSGSGKSSYLKILNRTILPTNGIPQYLGQPIDEIPVLDYRRDVLLVPQEVFLFDTSIRENFTQYYDAREEAHKCDADIKHFLDICCAPFSLDADCKSLSGGERQRVFLAIFLSSQPKVLLLDEPTSALDENTSVQLFKNLKSYCREENITVLSISHNEELAHQFADQIVHLENRL